MSYFFVFFLTQEKLMGEADIFLLNLRGQEMRNKQNIF